MKSLTEAKISIYRNVRDTQGLVTTLWTFLHSERHRDTIEAIRKVEDHKERSRLKTFLPSATVSGTFGAPRKAENLIEHSGYLCIDIDAGDNPALGDLSIVRDILESRSEIAYAGRSVSGRGWFGIVPLAYPEHHLEQFLAIEKEYADLGIHLDPSCKDVSRLRFVSYDEHPFVNEHPIPYEGRYVEQAVARPVNLPYQQTGDRDMWKVSRCCEVISQYHLDITEGYKNWFALACSLCTLGESGRQFFHVISSQYPKYKASETDKVFTNAMRTRANFPNSCQLGTFFYVCQSYGVTYSNKSHF